MKKKINSRTKGQVGERQIVKILNDFYQTDEFMRTPGSGAFGTTHKTSLTSDNINAFVGDIIVPKWFEYSLEVKSYKEISLWKILETGKTQFDEQLDEEEKDLGISEKKAVLLVFKQNRREWMTMFNKDLIEVTTYPRIEFEDRIIIPFRDFLKLYII